MSRIMKVRTIPRGYVAMDDLKGFVREKIDKTPAEWFMALYGKFGNPQDSGMWSYLLRHGTFVIKTTALDSETMDYAVWLSPNTILDARRKRVKAVNVIARRLNEKKVVFVSSEYEDKLYYAVRQKNAELIARQQGEHTLQSLRDAMDAAMTDEEKNILYGSLSQFMETAKEEIVKTIKEIFDEE